MHYICLLTEDGAKGDALPMYTHYKEWVYAVGLCSWFRNSNAQEQDEIAVAMIRLTYATITDTLGCRDFYLLSYNIAHSISNTTNPAAKSHMLENEHLHLQHRSTPQMS